jgi:hypothetical protein
MGIKRLGVWIPILGLALGVLPAPADILTVLVWFDPKAMSVLPN